ncbi:MAG: hypothetical protein EBU26_15485 [Verrucomicrobia bacterium]|nr:hypothetical protein [Verrucomicrobiota bacterium]
MRWNGLRLLAGRPYGEVVLELSDRGDDQKIHQRKCDQAGNKILALRGSLALAASLQLPRACSGSVRSSAPGDPSVCGGLQTAGSQAATAGVLS